MLVQRSNDARSHGDAQLLLDGFDHGFIDALERGVHDTIRAAASPEYELSRSAVLEQNLQDRRHALLHEHRGLFRRRAGARWNADWRQLVVSFEHAFGDLVCQGHEQIALVGEVLVQGGPADVRQAAHIRDAGGVKAPLRESAESAVEDLRLAFGGRLVGPLVFRN